MCFFCNLFMNTSRSSIGYTFFFPSPPGLVATSDRPKPELSTSAKTEYRPHCRYQIFGFGRIFGAHCRIPPNTNILSKISTPYPFVKPN
jgi:hypothetical protein